MAGIRLFKSELLMISLAIVIGQISCWRSLNHYTEDNTPTAPESDHISTPERLNSDTATPGRMKATQKAWEFQQGIGRTSRRSRQDEMEGVLRQPKVEVAVTDAFGGNPGFPNAWYSFINGQTSSRGFKAVVDRSSASTKPQSEASTSESDQGRQNRHPFIRGSIVQSTAKHKIEQAARIANLRRIILGQMPANISIDQSARKLVLGKVDSAVDMPTHSMQCYKAVCTNPSGISKELWEANPEWSRRLYFPLTTIDRRKARGVEVEQANLNLFMRPVEGCPCVYDNGEQIPGYRVSVRQFIRRHSARKGRVVKRFLELETLTAPLGGNTQLSFNVTRAVRTWTRRPSRNLGFDITVFTLNGTAVDANDAIIPPHCTDSSAVLSCRGRHGGAAGGFSVLTENEWPTTKQEKYIQAFKNVPFLEVATSSRKQRVTRTRRRNSSRSTFG